MEEGKVEERRRRRRARERGRCSGGKRARPLSLPTRPLTLARVEGRRRRRRRRRPFLPNSLSLCMPPLRLLPPRLLPPASAAAAAAAAWGPRCAQPLRQRGSAFRRRQSVSQQSHRSLGGRGREGGVVVASTTGAQGRRRRLRRFNHGGVQKFSAFVVGDIWKTVAREEEDGKDHGKLTRRIR